MAPDGGIPGEVEEWLEEHNVEGISEEDVVRTPLAASEEKHREFILVSVFLDELNFENHRYNPRQPSKTKINSLAASIKSLGLLSPLTCAYLTKKDSQDIPQDEDVILLDGRHRYEALRKLATKNPQWANNVKIDIKVYLNLNRSDLFVLATYLNRSRKKLKKGEYYKFVVKIYEEKKLELELEDGEPHTEEEIFNAISSKQLKDRNFDLSVGRIVGLTAFNEQEEGSWYPYVSIGQSEKLQDETDEGYCPITAGNMASFLRYLCKTGPYEDEGIKRSIERENVLGLGKVFNDVGILSPVPSRKESTGPSMACKHWPVKTFGALLSESSIFETNGEAPLAQEDQEWDAIQAISEEYLSIMEEQAEYVNEWKESDQEDLELLSKAWSYQTQMNMIKPKLREAFEAANLGVSWSDGG